jgi:hypothetical protein
MSAWLGSSDILKNASRKQEVTGNSMGDWEGSLIELILLLCMDGAWGRCRRRRGSAGDVKSKSKAANDYSIGDNEQQLPTSISVMRYCDIIRCVTESQVYFIRNVARVAYSKYETNFAFDSPHLYISHKHVPLPCSLYSHAVCASFLPLRNGLDHQPILLS